MDELTFEDPSLQKILVAADGVMRARAATEGWKHVPWGQGGNFFRAKWAVGAGARDDCVIAGGSAHRRDQRCVELYTLFYPKDWPTVFGLGMQGLATPADTGWGANVYLAVGGKTVVGEGFSVSFDKFDAGTGDPKIRLHAGTSNEYTVVATTVRLPSGRAPLDECRAMLASADGLKARLLELSSALEAQVMKVLAEHGAQAMEYGPYEGNGIPPVEMPRPLTAAEEKKAKAEAAAFFASQRQVVVKEYRAMYEAARRAAPWLEALGVK